MRFVSPVNGRAKWGMEWGGLYFRVGARSAQFTSVKIVLTNTSFFGSWGGLDKRPTESYNEDVPATTQDERVKFLCFVGNLARAIFELGMLCWINHQTMRQWRKRTRR